MRIAYSPYAPRFRGVFDADPAFRLVDRLFAERSAPRADYDLETLDEDRFRLTLNAVGLEESELSVELRGDLLAVEGESADGRHAVKRSFRLGEHMEVTGASLDKGLLAIEIERVVPEALKPRRIEIASGSSKRLARAAKKLIGGEKKAA